MVAGEGVGFAGAVGAVNVLGVRVAAAIGIRRAGAAVMFATKCVGRNSCPVALSPIFLPSAERRMTPSLPRAP